MKIRTLTYIAALGLAAAPAFADNHKKGEMDNKVAPDAATATEKVGEQVPTMKNDADPAKESTAPDKQTYTDEVGKAVPDMKAPKKADQ